ncbi:bifunctional tetrahydrofolate synthase/dihydrofolate synthase [Erwinia tracheiphila]|uniref:Dihydrofolate synthase/folylpolyglutamate synthase n=1 Tax=Erwinia tracheiphila TaxID=65700 RepID=A0A0M2KD70_9GAMM|nr:bifunctional tetrahydrofolate synthase/dihydrofolate synthase [Erwinia tracheiphila]AXF76509.1 bifunctional tetrahydrofolate synthase/dihydrofolate synthase [Erwinia tracheiphila]EOS96158.1 bifunctional folylpolyglutamate synthase/dihydrofolate synthase [Erwinia tracheiphila PSU-1]KKF35252.1 bifunctional folylpolyglutamate synthase/ dihydrofolate synthase [Erwinia tracheiphila]UIA84825.1 bifunctional tetrahydrofolate synthase/dihydrofolate synthase [Erwinia tracheiphila]UIA86913.1 bifunctio
MDTIPQATSSLVTWLHYLENLHGQSVDPGLERIAQVAQQLDLLTPAPFIFTVAGTNGKGTSCRMLETLLLAAGYRVGVYSSPHLLRYTERVRVQGAELAESDHTASFARIEAGRGNISLTYFEYSTLSALALFKQLALDVVILEVGLGGRLDATNIVNADIAVITSIALDHTDYLGPDRESIGREKAGIFRSGKPAVVGEPDMPLSIAEVAKSVGATLLREGQAWSYTVGENDWCFHDDRGDLAGLPLPQIPLPNAATVLAALRASSLDIDPAIIRHWLDKVVVTGRFQTISDSPRIILDVAHNPHAAAWLAGQLGRLAKNGSVHAVVGMLHDKDIPGTLACLKPQIDRWYCAPLDGPRGARADELMAHLTDADAFSCVADAFAHARRQALAQDIVLVCGSFHTVGQVMEMLEMEKGSGK